MGEKEFDFEWEEEGEEPQFVDFEDESKFVEF